MHSGGQVGWWSSQQNLPFASAPPSKGGFVGWGNVAGGGGADFIKMAKTTTTQKTLDDRLAARGPAGNPLPSITGQESVEELRQLIIEFSQNSLAQSNQLDSPFHIIGTLSYASMTTLINNLSHKNCLELFRMERECRALAMAANPHKNHGAQDENPRP
jgi:hypothetical protein